MAISNPVTTEIEKQASLLYCKHAGVPLSKRATYWAPLTPEYKAAWITIAEFDMVPF
ncbi:MAG: hypothetical protein HRU18_02760 [Pseudoalteromonas sp.]|uniref:hypothetical protein n=1 Tax=Pseudoalteromonas sp. TaxID=53249 RepID=UPI001D36275B|nr:hypothetical protein [Pseudoalteromonas sp.]NRA77105.1 hypothetical protein [Pseudoalteromonas sp.]